MNQNKSTKTIKDVVSEAKNIIAKKDNTIRLLKQAVRTAKGEKAVVFKMPDTMEVTNFPAIQKVEVMNKGVQDVKVTNLKDIELKVETQTVQFPEIQKVELVNLPTEGSDKSATWAPEIILATVKSFSNFFVKLWQMGITVRLDASERLKPLPVTVVDMFGNPIRERPQTIIPMYSGSGGTNITPVVEQLQTINSLVPSRYDYISLGYTGDNVTSVVYRLGGASGTVVSTLTLAYSGSNLTSVTKS